MARQKAGAIDVDSLAAEYRAGATIRELRDRYGLSYYIVRQKLAAVVPLRPRGQIGRTGDRPNAG